MRHDTIDDFVTRHLPPKAYAEQWDVEGLDEHVRESPGPGAADQDWAAEEGIANEEIERAHRRRPPTRAPPSAKPQVGPTTCARSRRASCCR